MKQCLKRSSGRYGPSTASIPIPIPPLSSLSFPLSSSQHAGDGSLGRNDLRVAIWVLLRVEDLQRLLVLLHGIVSLSHPLAAISQIHQSNGSFLLHLQVLEYPQGLLVTTLGSFHIPLHVYSHQAEGVPRFGHFGVIVSVGPSCFSEVLHDLVVYRIPPLLLFWFLFVVNMLRLGDFEMTIR